MLASLKIMFKLKLYISAIFNFYSYKFTTNIYKYVIIPIKLYLYRLHEQTAILQIPNTIQSDYLLRLPRPSDRHQIRGDET